MRSAPRRAPNPFIPIPSARRRAPRCNRHHCLNALLLLMLYTQWERRFALAWCIQVAWICRVVVSPLVL